MSDVDTDKTQSIHERIMGARRSSGEKAAAHQAVEPASGKSHWLRWALLSAAGVAVLAGGGIALYKNPFGGEASAQTVAAADQSKTASGSQDQQAAQGDDLFSKHAADAGVKLCNATYSALGKVLTTGTRYTVLTESAKTEADKRSIQGLVGMTYDGKNGDYAGPAAGVVFASPEGEACGGNMVRIVPLNQNCQAAAGLLPKGTKPLSPLDGVAVYALPTGGQAMLVSSGSGCVAVSILRTAI